MLGTSKAGVKAPGSPLLAAENGAIGKKVPAADTTKLSGGATPAGAFLATDRAP